MVYRAGCTLHPTPYTLHPKPIPRAIPVGENARRQEPCAEVTTAHPGPFVGVSQKSIFKGPCQLLAINAHEMAPRTRRWLQERGRDTPT